MGDMEDDRRQPGRTGERTFVVQNEAPRGVERHEAVVPRLALLRLVLGVHAREVRDRRRAEQLPQLDHLRVRFATVTLEVAPRVA